MRDSRRTRLAFAIGLTAAISAMIGDLLLRPTIERKLR